MDKITYIHHLASDFKCSPSQIIIAGGYVRDDFLGVDQKDVDVYMFTPNVTETTFLEGFLYNTFGIDNVKEIKNITESNSAAGTYSGALIDFVYEITFKDNELPVNLIMMKRIGETIGIVDTVLPFSCNLSNCYVNFQGKQYFSREFIEGALEKKVIYTDYMPDSYKEKMKKKFPDYTHEEV